jgi:hypothetical protein
MPLRAHLSAFLAHNMDFYDCLKLRESDPCTSKLGLLARSRMAQQEGLLAGYASSLQLARRASGISWCGLCIAISGLLMASFWKWSTQTAGDLSMTLRWLLDDPRPCISTDAIGAAAAAAPPPPPPTRLDMVRKHNHIDAETRHAATRITNSGNLGQTRFVEKKLFG